MSYYVQYTVGKYAFTAPPEVSQNVGWFPHIVQTEPVPLDDAIVKLMQLRERTRRGGDLSA